MKSNKGASLGLGCMVAGAWVAASCGTDLTSKASFPLALEGGNDVFCPADTTFDSVWRLCVSGTKAIGPFTNAMSATCNENGGGTACAGNTWALDFARSIRGTGVCPPGATLKSSGLCVEGTQAYGPFTRDHVENCKRNGGGPVCEELTRWDAAFAESTLPRAPVNTQLPWKWISGLDYGLRSDECGSGEFKAPRGGGSRVHKGVDVLLPVGANLYSPCGGTVETGYEESGYGNYVVVTCRVPDVIAGGNSTYVSMLYGHLSRFAVGNGSAVSAGQKVGEVGKSGNASSGCVNPHVHFEAIVESTALRSLNAMPRSMKESESRKESVEKSLPGLLGNIDTLASALSSRCMGPTGFRGVNGTSYGTNIDPFILLTCLAGNKPTLQNSGINIPFIRWSSWYAARTFDVNVGQR